MNGSRTPRRRFLALGVAAAGCANRKGGWRSLSIDEAGTAAAIAERLIPTDQDPGAAWAGAVNFIDLQLAGPYKRFRKRYYEGLLGVNQVSRDRFGRRFVELAPAQQDELLTLLEKGRTPPRIWHPAQARQFFQLILSHTMQSFYGDPRHGGNREAVSWRMLGVPVLPVRGQQGGKS